jgi:hypothetical protein
MKLIFEKFVRFLQQRWNSQKAAAGHKYLTAVIILRISDFLVPQVYPLDFFPTYEAAGEVQGLFPTFVCIVLMLFTYFFYIKS